MHRRVAPLRRPRGVERHRSPHLDQHSAPCPAAATVRPRELVTRLFPPLVPQLLFPLAPKPLSDHLCVNPQLMAPPVPPKHLLPFQLLPSLTTASLQMRLLSLSRDRDHKVRNPLHLSLGPPKQGRPLLLSDLESILDLHLMPRHPTPPDPLIHRLTLLQYRTNTLPRDPGHQSSKSPLLTLSSNAFMLQNPPSHLP